MAYTSKLIDGIRIIDAYVDEGLRTPIPGERLVLIDPKTGLNAFFISKDDLIAAKLASGRPQDLADVSAVQKAMESQGPQGARKRIPETKPGGPSF